MQDSRNIGEEQNLLNLKNKEIKDFWQLGNFSSFSGKNKVRINYCYFNHGNFAKNLIIVPGRGESYLKYQELSYQFFLLGYNTFIIDHRGQGLSERLTNDPNKGYVDSFDDYVDDLEHFVDLSKTLSPTDKNYLLAHSMGGAITLRYLQERKIDLSAVALSSPMIAINSGNVPSNIAMKLVQCNYALNVVCSKRPWYLIGHGKHKIVDFHHNHVTHSAIRYQLFAELYQSISKIQLGGVTLKWLIEADKNRQHLFDCENKLPTPTLVLQASEDTIVDNAAQDNFCRKNNLTMGTAMNNAQPVVIKGARHELLFESDEYRKKALNHIIDWFDKH